jgi:arylsulfatase A-like enzyme
MKNLIMIAAIAVVSCVAPHFVGAADKPNVLFIAIDDLRAELGCYGADHIISPNIDALAASGVRFDRAYCQQAICGPSRASVLTGLRPDSSRVHGNHTHFRSHYPDIVTLPQHFKNNGYHTRAMGKIYHGVFPEGSSRTVADTFGDKPSWSVPAFRPGPRYYYTEEGIDAAKEIYQKIYKPANPGPDDWTKKLVFGPATEAPDVPDSTLYDGQVADRTVASLKDLSQKPDEPFFLAVGFIKPHSPYIAPKKYWDLYDPAKIDIVGETEFLEGVPKVALHGSGELRRYTDQAKNGPIPNEAQRRVKHAYYACISYIDAQIGRVLAELDAQGLRDNTIVVLWSDHGYHLGEQNLWGKTTNFELDTRVPLIVRAPGRAGNGQTSDALVELVDLFPSLTDLCGLDQPHELEGTSLVPLLDTPRILWKKGAFSQFTRGKIRGYSIRTPRSRYTEWRNTSTQEVTAREFYIYGDEHPLESPNQAEDVPELTEAYAERLAAGHGWKTVRRELNRTVTDPEFSIAKVFTDHMVLQRGKQILVWGTAAAGSSIDVRFGDQQGSTMAEPTGHWQFVLEPLPASTAPVDLIVNEQTIRDVLVGDVWLCSGQSNMRWMLKQSQDADAEIKQAAEVTNLRLLDLTADIYPVGRAYDRKALRRTTADNYFAWSGWQHANPESAATFSAVAWHFGRRLCELNPDVPVGLIHNAIGGTPMESWIPESTLLADPELQRLVTFPWYSETHPDYPKWCGLRGRQNLAKYFASPDGPVPHHPFEPGFLFDSGVAPLSKFPISGILWYQGESNATQDGANSPPINPAWNHRLFLSLISSWRKAWSSRQLPFVFAQLPGLNRNWPLFREMQLETAAADPNVHMAVTIDVGHATNVHPPNKRPVGHRMAELALAFAASPVTTKVTPGEIAFDQPVKSSDGKPIRGFQLAGVDKVFHPATATVIGRTVKVVCDNVSSPVAVRFGWENDPDLNLVGVNGEHPVSPFRSDRWETVEIRLPGVPPQPEPFLPAGFTGFETAKPGPLKAAFLGGAIWRAPAGHAEISAKLARTGQHCLHLMGGKHSEVEFTLSSKYVGKKYAQLTFAAERWTRRAPFTFRVEASTTKGKWQEIYNGDNAVKVGRPYLNRVEISLPDGAQQFRMTCTSPPGTGILIDDMNLVEAKPMTVTRVAVAQQTAPVLIGQKNSPLLQLEIETEGSLSPKRVSAVSFNIPAGRALIHEVHFQGQDFISPGGGPAFKIDYQLRPGLNILPLTCELGPDASLDEFVTAACSSIQLDDKQVIKLETGSSSIRRRIGVAVRQHGDDGVHTYRIPGITTTNSGTLIAVYDNRNQRGGDLPGDIDVGMSRSTDGGQTWEPMRVIMDMGKDPKWSYDGIGDPSILTDRVTGDIWVAATWSHGNRSWRGSGPGMTPEETGQFMLARSADDGKTWSKPINITDQVKANPKWRFVLQGPGNGITTKDGTLVFPAQFRGEDGEPVNGKPFSTIISSKDRGKTWTIGTGVKIDTTEAQIVQLGNGSIMINCRDNRGGSRSIYTTNDLGQTWSEHPTTRKALPEPVCNADILRIVHPKHGPLVFFSNPNTTRGRHHFTMKVSNDEGMTWPAKWHTLYDERPGSGYSTLTQIDDEHVGVLYEGPGELYFLRFSIDELLRK